MLVSKTVPRISTLVVGHGPAVNAALAKLRPLEARKNARDDIGLVHLTPRTSLWETMPRNLLMGQSSEMLADMDYHIDVKKMPFMKVKDFNSYQNKRYDDSMMKLGGFSLSGSALKIKKHGKNDFQVVYHDHASGGVREIAAANIIYAGGPSAEKSILNETPLSARPSRLARAFPEYCSGVSILTGQSVIGQGGVVVVVGDGPTALWVAQFLADAGNEVFVIGPDSAKAFSGANPGGRNSGIIKSLGDRFYSGSIELVEEREVSSRQDWSEAGTSLHIRNFQPVYSQGGPRSMQLPVSAVVSAMGPVNGFSTVLDPQLVASLSPMQGCLTMATDDQDFLVFGSSAFYGARADGRHLSFDQAGSLIVQPPVGVAVIEQSSRMLSRGMKDGWKFDQFIALEDLHPGNFSPVELREALMGQGVDQRGAEEMTGQIVKHRQNVAKSREYGGADLSKDLQTVMSGKSLDDG